MAIGRTIDQATEFLSVRFELETLAWARLAHMFTDRYRERYAFLCQQERDLLSLA